MSKEEREQTILRTNVIDDVQPLEEPILAAPDPEAYLTRVKDNTCPLNYGKIPLPVTRESFNRYTALLAKKLELQLRKQKAQTEQEKEMPTKEGLPLAISIEDIKKYYRLPIAKCEYSDSEIQISIKIPLN